MKGQTMISKRNSQELAKLNLGSTNTLYPTQYAPEILESITCLNTKDDAWISLICNEFTSLCPKTNQPDFAKIYINYIPAQKLVESKSLKLYLFSFRNHGAFHEDCINVICKDLFRLLRPNFIEVIGEFSPRGGIAIWPYCSQSSSSLKYKKLKAERLEDYFPGKYSKT